MKKITFVLFAALMLGACKKVETASTSSTPTPVASATPAASAIPNDQQAVKQVVIEGNNFSYNLKEIKVKKGETVKLTFKNVEGFHDWRVDELNVATQLIGAGKEDVVTFVADKQGTFEYYCSVGQHRAMGMVGKLIVE